MARPIRIEYEGAVYHVTARGNERKKIYFSKKDYEQFLNYVAEAQKRYGIHLHSYVLMSNHYHLILETPEANLSKAMHYINGSYSTYINIKKKRSGHLFQGRYKAIVVAKDNYLMELSRYIHLNPVRAGMVQKPEEYHYSSYKSYITDRKDKIISQGLLLGIVSGHKGEARRNYKLFVESAIGQENNDPMKDVYGGIIFGGKRFIKDTLKKIKEERLQKEDISQRRVLQAKYETADIIDYISGYFRLKLSDFCCFPSIKRGLRGVFLFMLFFLHTLTPLFRGENYFAAYLISMG